MRAPHRRPRAWPLAATTLCVAAAAAGCHAFEPLSNCRDDGDCGDTQWCHPQGRFCETDRRPIALGATLSLSGDLGAFGREMRLGFDVAVQVLNEAGGVLGRAVTGTVLDDESNNPLAIQNVTSLVDQGVLGVVGPFSSSGALATQSVTFAARVLQISPSAGTPLLDTAQPPTDRYFFRTISTMRNGPGAAIALFAPTGSAAGEAPRAACRRMAILQSDDAAGDAFYDAIADLLARNGGCVTLRQRFPTGVILDYGPQITALMAAAPDCAVVVAVPDTGAALVRQFNAAAARDTTHDWSRFYWIGTTTLHTDAFLQAARRDPLRATPTDAEGVYGGDTDSTPPTAEFARFRAVFNAHLGRPADQPVPPLVANTYDAAVLVGLAAQAAGTTRDRVRVRDGLWAVSATGPDHRVYGPGDVADALAALRRGEPIHYAGASSRLVFDATGTVTNPTLVWRVTDGAFAVVRRYTEDDAAAINALPVNNDPRCPPLP